ncbi:hypothetical protein F5X97DRAFT_323020 [Nemania serpens]|nr:hypothetical protein F5X97DRAFT_323020 [Nemania serpens]
MENFTQDIRRVLPTADKGKRVPNHCPKRPTHCSLPKLTIPSYRGPAPKEIQPSQAEFFLKNMAAISRAPGSLLPLPVPPASSALPSDLEHDPYLEDLPMPPTLQFTKNDAIEIAQWREIVGTLRETHADALEQLMDNPRDSKLREKVQALRVEREKNVNAIALAHERRHIRKNFRKDFNNVLPGW